MRFYPPSADDFGVPLNDFNFGDRWTQALFWSGDRLEELYLFVAKIGRRLAPHVCFSDCFRTIAESIGLLAVIVAVGSQLHWSRSLQLAYVVPILHATHRGGPKWGIFVAVLATFVAGGIDMFNIRELPIKLAFESGIRLTVLASIVMVVRYHQRKLAGTLEIANRDGLTGALNRRAVEEIARRKIEQVTLRPTPLRLVMIDCDKFKWINDNLGHLFGDQVLRTLVRILQNTLGPECLVGRSGGDEFLVVVPDFGHETLEKMLARSLAQFQDSTLVMGAKSSFSFGLAEFARDGVTYESLIEAADRDMYQRKASKAAVYLTAPVKQSA